MWAEDWIFPLTTRASMIRSCSFRGGPIPPKFLLRGPLTLVNTATLLGDGTGCFPAVVWCTPHPKGDIPITTSPSGRGGTRPEECGDGGLPAYLPARCKRRGVGGRNIPGERWRPGVSARGRALRVPGCHWLKGTRRLARCEAWCEGREGAGDGSERSEHGNVVQSGWQ